MVFGDLSKISLGAAAAVVAERGGYVSALSDKARASGFDAAGDLLAAPPPALASVAASATSFADPSEFAFPTTLPELQDRVVAGLSAARELMREYLPAELAALGGAAAPSPADAATAATAATAAIGRPWRRTPASTAADRRRFLAARSAASSPARAPRRRFTITASSDVGWRWTPRRRRRSASRRGVT